MINNLPILYYPLETNINHKSNDKICQDYINSLIWTTNYYFKECIMEMVYDLKLLHH